MNAGRLGRLGSLGPPALLVRLARRLWLFLLILARRLTPLLRRLRADTGALIGLLLLLGGGVFAWTVLLPAEQRYAELSAAMASSRAAASLVPALAGPGAAPEVMKALYASAAQAGVQLERVQFQQRPVGEELHLTAILPLSGDYPGIRLLVDATRKLVPGTTLAALQLRRSATDGGRLSGQLQFLFRFKPGGADTVAVSNAIDLPPPAKDIFSRDAPPPAIVIVATAPPKPETPPEPETPPLTFHYLGRIVGPGGKAAYVLESAGAVRVVRPGDPWGGDYLFVGYHGGQLEFRYRPLDKVQMLPVGELR